MYLNRTNKVIERGNNLIALLKENGKEEMADRVRSMMDSAMSLYNNLEKQYPRPLQRTPEQKKSLYEAYEAGITNISEYLDSFVM